MTQLIRCSILAFALVGCTVESPSETYSLGGSPEILTPHEFKAAISATSVSIARLDQPTRVVKVVPPRYPPAARREGIEGTVLIAITIDERGHVVNPIALGEPNELLAQAAVAAVRQWEFQPHTENGLPTTVRVNQPVSFVLDPPEADTQ